MTRLAAAVVVLSAVALHGQTPGSVVPRTGTATIRGRVVGSPAQTPLRNAHVELQLDDRPFSSLLSDADGRFTAAALPAGRYVLSAEKAGYVKTTLGTAIGTPLRINLAEGA